MSSKLNTDPYYWSILDGVNVARRLSDNSDKKFEEWIGELANLDRHDRGDRVLLFSSEIVENVVDGHNGRFFELCREDQEDLMRAHQFFRCIKNIRSIASEFVSRVDGIRD